MVVEVLFLDEIVARAEHEGDLGFLGGVEVVQREERLRGMTRGDVRGAVRGGDHGEGEFAVGHVRRLEIRMVMLVVIDVGSGELLGQGWRRGRGASVATF